MTRWLALTVALLSPPPLLADDAEAHKIIDKAIKAAGLGEKVPAITMKGKGTYYGAGEMGFPYTASWSVQLPAKVRFDVDNVFTLVVSGDHGWIKMGEDVNPLSKEQLAEQKDSLYADWVASLVTLKDKSFTLALAGETKVNDKPAVGVKVSSKDHRDVTLYFDKDSGLLTKIEQTVKDAQSGKEIKQETIVKEYKDVGKVKVRSKTVMNRDGKLFVDGEMTEINLHDSLPDKTFEKP